MKTKRQKEAVKCVLYAAAKSVMDGKYPTLEIALFEMAQNHLKMNLKE
jgi:hypothetical protein